MFYGLLLVYIGFRFIITSPSPEQRDKSKEMLKNTFIMIILVQASYFIYGFGIELESMLTTPLINMIKPEFFQLTVDNLVNLGLELLLGLTYVMILLFALILLMVRYAIVCIGLVFFPIGIFLYFIEPVRSYGKFILNFLGVNIFITFFVSIILLIYSKLLEIPFFENVKILVMIAAFSTVCWLMMKSFHFSMENAARKTATYAVKAAKYLA